MLTERQKQILTLVVREYTDNGNPVSSKELVRKHRLPMSPATLRTELSHLCEMGYLIQPHTSAGRVPTDRGYRFYIKNLMSPEPVSKEEKFRIRTHLSRSAAHPGRNVARVISESTHSIGFYFDPGEDTLYREGLPEILQGSDFRHIEQIARFVELIDFLEHRLQDVFNEMWNTDEPTVLVGEDTLFPLHGDYSMLYSGYRLGRNEYLFGVLGPLRMDYARTLSILDFIRKELTGEAGHTFE